MALFDPFFGGLNSSSPILHPLFDQKWLKMVKNKQKRAKRVKNGHFLPFRAGVRGRVRNLGFSGDQKLYPTGFEGSKDTMRSLLLVTCTILCYCYY